MRHALSILFLMSLSACGSERRDNGQPQQIARDKSGATLTFGGIDKVWVSRGLAGAKAVWLTTDHKLAVVAATLKGGVFRLYDPAGFHQLMEKDLAL